MNRLALAAPLLAGASICAFAAADVPRHKCDPRPVLPGQRMMEEPTVRKNFQRDVDAYKTCIKVYAEERAAAAKANTDAGNAAITEYNETMKALQDAQASR
jgi:hypothetical protein